MRLLLLLALSGCGDDTPANPGDSDSDSDSDTPSDTGTSCDADDDRYETIECGGDDCDDASADVHPDAEDTFGDDVDQNCDHTDGIDVDQDGFASTDSGGDDCDDGRAEINPGIAEEGEWTLETVVSEGDCGTHASLALDADGNAHATYQILDFEGIGQHLGYATNAEGAWAFEDADCGAACDQWQTSGWNTSLALGSDGTPFVTFDKWWELIPDTGLALHVFFASRAGGTWDGDPIDPEGLGWSGISLHTSLAIDMRDGADTAHVAYFEPNEGVLEHATNESGSWVIETVDSGGPEGDEVGLYSSLAIDADGALHIAYHDQTRGDLMYATNGSGAWEIQRIDEDGDAGTYAALALDASGAAHIAHHNRITSDLLYTSNASGDWVTETVDSEGTVGAYCSIALDADGAAHVSYYDGSHGALRYATNASGRFVLETVDAATTTGLFTSIKVDADGLPHVAYYDATAGALRYGVAAPDGLDQNCDGVTW